MSFPKLVRAGTTDVSPRLIDSMDTYPLKDTLDLQDHQHPTARDHTHHVAQGDPVAAHHAPHQEAALRQYEEERHNIDHGYQSDQWGSGRSSHEGSELLDEDPDFLIDGHHHHHHDGAAVDELAIQQNGGVMGSPDDSDMMDGDVNDDEDDDDMADKISSSPSISDEDIDFEFVYALHTFVATVEGQANATKGDTMVLLDDSNSYWWLVRVVKDNSIGYLPAEHIETPTERLARLNKHRNIDLAHSMLTDMQEKSKNPLKKAMRRRNAKVVQFSTPTYFEPPEQDWSDSEPEQDQEEMESDAQDARNAQSSSEASDDHQHQNHDTVDQIEPDHDHREMQQPQHQQQQPPQQIAAEGVSPVIEQKATEMPPTEDELHPNEESDSRVTRNGTIRNTDSFFKDDTVEPKKITLTPNILRDDSNRSLDLKDKATAASIFDQIDKEANANEKAKDAKSKKDKEKDKRADKEKKPGMLSGLFKRKDKKIKVDEAAGGTVSKRESEILSSPSDSPVISGRGSPTAPVSPGSPGSVKRQSSNGKLSKMPPNSVRQNGLRSPPNGLDKSAIGKPTPIQPPISSQDNHLMGPDLRQGPVGPPPSAKQELSVRIPGGDEPITVETRREQGTGKLLSPLADLFSSSPKQDQFKKEKLQPATERIDLDADSSPEHQTRPLNRLATGSIDEQRTSEPFRPDRPPPQAPNHGHFNVTGSMPGQFDGDLHNGDASRTDRSVSPVSPATPPQGFTDFRTPQPSSLDRKTPTDTSSYTTFNGQDSVNTASTLPTPIDIHHDQDGEQSWDDAALRRYLEDDSSRDVHDLLVILTDNTNVVPVSHDHPILVNAGFQKQQQRLQDMSDQLDGLLTGYLDRKKASRQNDVSSKAR